MRMSSPGEERDESIATRDVLGRESKHDEKDLVKAWQERDEKMKRAWSSQRRARGMKAFLHVERTGVLRSLLEHLVHVSLVKIWLHSKRRLSHPHEIVARLSKAGLPAVHPSRQLILLARHYRRISVRAPSIRVPRPSKFRRPHREGVERVHRRGKRGRRSCPRGIIRSNVEAQRRRASRWNSHTAPHTWVAAGAHLQGLHRRHHRRQGWLAHVSTLRHSAYPRRTIAALSVGLLLVRTTTLEVGRRETDLLN